MPELPEVEVIVNELRPQVVGQRIMDVRTDRPKYFLPIAEADFRACIRGRRISAIDRRAKYVMIHLSGGHLLLVHQKISGRLLVGKWVRKSIERYEHSQWRPVASGSKTLPRGRFVHLVFELDSGQQLALSDLR